MEPHGTTWNRTLKLSIYLIVFFAYAVPCVLQNDKRIIATTCQDSSKGPVALRIELVTPVFMAIDLHFFIYYPDFTAQFFKVLTSLSPTGGIPDINKRLIPFKKYRRCYKDFKIRWGDHPSIIPIPANILQDVIIPSFIFRRPIL